ncbi:hypothetical protein ACFOLF_35075 [Paenibacillus sepulcri]|uniref:Nuclear transport factor 2 family protein n=1 Tax=Paenibacillus sepulcri TaxID=359917 RepID=A0ABS7C6E5_9BACL|nr:hypothetical protein [Paenibacillus sepulcri]
MRTQTVTQFFRAYEQRINDALADPESIEVPAMTAAYTESFLEANPKGVQVFQNDEQYAEALKPAFENQRRIGTKSMSITSIHTFKMDDLHAAAAIHWRAVYCRQKDGKEISIDFDETYLLQFIGDTPRIFAYIAGDEEAALKEHDLID